MRPAYWELGICGRMPPGRHRNPIVCGRKFCAGCGRWRHTCDFGPLQTRDHMLRARCRGCARAWSREQRHHRTQEQIDLLREYDRIYKEAKRREAGTPKRNFHHRRWVAEDEHESLGRLPIEPLVTAMTEHYRRQRSNGHPEWSWEELSLATGISYRTITRYVTGVNNWVRIDNADRIAIAIGVPLMMIYPLEEAS